MNGFDIKNKLDSLLYVGFNFLSDIRFFLNFNKNDIVRKNVSFKNRFSGERCFILGTGPSLRLLTSDQIENLKGEYLFGVNSFYKADKFKILKPSFYALTDTKYLDVSSGEFSKVFKSYKEEPPVLITDYRSKAVLDDSLSFKGTVFLYQKNYPISNMRLDLSGNSSITMNVVGTCIQSAIYMGFKEIYLLGCDYSAFCNLGEGHCYDDAAELSDLKESSYNLAFYLKYYHLTTVFHYLLRKEADKVGVRVINVTESSLLDAYPKKSIKEVI